MKLEPEVLAAARAAARDYKVPLSTVIGIMMQESAGHYSYKIAGEVEPAVRHEGHYFYKRLKGDALATAIKKGLASPKAGGVPNPSSQADRWRKLLLPAMAIDKPAEIESVSWGLGQVMGAHWKKLGFTSAEALMLHARAGITEQVDLMMRYCKSFGLIDELQRGDIEGFVRGYNGSGNVAAYSKSIRRYIADALKTYGTATEASKTVDGVPVKNVKVAEEALTMLRMGTSGQLVREAQELLVRDGFAVKVDGDFGTSTRDAVKAFQKKHKLDVDGKIGPQTWAALNLRRLDPAEVIGQPGAAEAVTKLPESRQGAVAAGAGALIEVAKSGIKEGIDAISPALGTSHTLDGLYAALTAGAAIIAVGGVAWYVWGIVKSRKTYGVKVATDAA